VGAPLIELLRPGDRRTVGQVDEVVRAVLGQPELAASLVDCLDGVPEALAMRASDALEKVIAADPTIGAPYRARLVQICLGANQKEVQWHLAQLLPVLQPTEREARDLVRVWRELCHTSPSSIVRTSCLQAVADLAEAQPAFGPDLDELLTYALEDGTPAMRARARLLTRPG
jgi:hypothetical protein